MQILSLGQILRANAFHLN
uniref:Uncharacterized protein n=1 Tax=Arundo donax TaxID=35708 RepID=A0A0A9EG06_ARUDO